MISLKFGTEFYHVTADIVQMFKLKVKCQGQGVKVKVTA